MDKQLNEANVNLSIQDLSSSDLNALSQILSLAGQAEQPAATEAPGIAAMAGPDGDLSSGVGSVDLGTPTVSVGTSEDVADTYGADDMGMDDTGMDDMGMDDSMDDSMDDMSMFEDIDRIASLSGIELAESEEVEQLEETEVLDEEVEQIDEEVIEEAEEDEIDEGWQPEIYQEPEAPGVEAAFSMGEEPCDQEMPAEYSMRENLDAIDAIVEAGDEDAEVEADADLEQVDENSHGHYDFDLDEDAVADMTSPGLGDNRVFGPYGNEMQCMNDARLEIPGAKRDVEVKLSHKPDGWYWSKLTESVDEVAELTDQLNEQFESFLKGE